MPGDILGDTKSGIFACKKTLLNELKESKESKQGFFCV